MVNNPYLNQTKTILLPGQRPGEAFLCYDITILKGNHTGVWQEVNPVSHALPAFITQLVIITSLSNILFFLLKPLHQPRIVAEILAGALMGPSVLGRIKQHCSFLDAVFSTSTFMMLESMGNIGLIYFLFLIGLEIDLNTISKVGRKALGVAFAGTIFPFVVGIALYYLLSEKIGKPFQIGCIYWGVSLTVTSLPVIAQILSNLKLLYTDIGKTAMSSALVNELLSWVLLAIIIPLGSNLKKAHWALLSTIGFVVFCFLVIRPTITWIIIKTQKGSYYNEETICVILTAVLACGLVTDILGTNSMIGAFVFGLVIPSGLLGPRFVEVLKGFVEDLLMPVFFTVSGMRTNFDALGSSSSWYLVVVIIALACLCKIVSTLVISLFYGMPLREGLALGVLMNTKGLLALMVINSARDQMVIEDKAFIVMFVSILLMTMATQPIINVHYRPSKRFLQNNQRVIQSLKPEAELRILACVHESHSIPGIVNLLETSNPARRSPITVFALHLIQLTGHTTALLIVHGPTRSISNRRQNNQILEPFERLVEAHGGVSVQQLTAMSPYETMHEDISTIAEDKRVALIILPFHKRQTIHNTMEDTKLAYKDVNDNVLANPPCSIGILIDREFGMSSNYGIIRQTHVVMIYIGGPDDREALSYAWRMAGHPNTSLTVIRFVEKNHEVVDVKLFNIIGELVDYEDNDDDEDTAVVVEVGNKDDKRIDEIFLSEFRYKTGGDMSIVFMEKAVSDGSETIETIKSMGSNYDLYVVGRGIGVSSPVTEGIGQWSECPELGAIGDLLVTSEFSSTVSVLVVQQYVATRRPSTSTGGKQVVFNGYGMHKNNQQFELSIPRQSECSSEPFVKHREKDEGYCSDVL